MNDAVDDLTAIDAAIRRAAQALLRQQRSDGHWVFELEADATIPAEYVLLRQYLAEPDNRELERKIGVYLRRIQGEHGGWPLFHDGAFDISATVKAYFCLKMIGDSPEAPHMARARAAILAHGGARRANVFTRILLALFGELSWRHVPTMPVELMLLPRWFPIHLSRMSYWARTVIVPLLVLAALRVRARNPRGVRIQELFAATAKAPPKAPHTSQARLGAVLQRARWRVEGGRAVLAEGPAPPRHRALRDLRDGAPERRGRAGRDLPRHGQHRDDV